MTRAIRTVKTRAIRQACANLEMCHLDNDCSHRGFCQGGQGPRAVRSARAARTAKAARAASARAARTAKATRAAGAASARAAATRADRASRAAWALKREFNFRDSVRPHGADKFFI